jgi:hypothetical protein
VVHLLAVGDNFVELVCFHECLDHLVGRA